MKKIKDKFSNKSFKIIFPISLANKKKIVPNQKKEKFLRYYLLQHYLLNLV